MTFSKTCKELPGWLTLLAPAYFYGMCSRGKGRWVSLFRRNCYSQALSKRRTPVTIGALAANAGKFSPSKIGLAN